MTTPLRNDQETREWLHGLLVGLDFWDAGDRFLTEEEYVRVLLDGPNNGGAIKGDGVVWLVGWNSVRKAAFKTRESLEAFLRLIKGGLE